MARSARRATGHDKHGKRTGSRPPMRRKDEGRKPRGRDTKPARRTGYASSAQSTGRRRMACFARNAIPSGTQSTSAEKTASTRIATREKTRSTRKGGYAERARRSSSPASWESIMALWSQVTGALPASNDGKRRQREFLKEKRHKRSRKLNAHKASGERKKNRSRKPSRALTRREALTRPACLTS